MNAEPASGDSDARAINSNEVHHFVRSDDSSGVRMRSPEEIFLS